MLRKVCPLRASGLLQYIDSSSRYETHELNFLAARKEIRKGPNNITDVWTKFIEGMAHLPFKGNRLHVQ